MTPQVQARLLTGAPVRVTVSLADGPDAGAAVTTVLATVEAVDRRRCHQLLAVTDDGRTVVVPLPQVEATVLPLPRPHPNGGAA